MKKEKSSIEIITYNYCIALIPLIIYGIYKNVYIVYTKGLLDILMGIKIVLLPLIAVSIAIFIEIALHYLKMKKWDFKILKNSFLPLYFLIISCTLSPNINILIFILTFIVIGFLIHYLNETKNIILNPLVIIKLVLVLLLLLFMSNSYFNIYELSVNQEYALIDTIFGRSVGGVFSTNIFLIILAYIYLSSTKIYKKEIPFYMMLFYSIFTIIFAIILGTSSTLFMDIFNSSFFFAAVFIAPQTIYSPYTKKGKIIFGSLLGVMSFFMISFVSHFEGVYIAILLGGFFTKFIDKYLALK